MPLCLTVELDASVLSGVCHHKGQVINHCAITNGQAVRLVAAGIHNTNRAGQTGQSARCTELASPHTVENICS